MSAMSESRRRRHVVRGSAVLVLAGAATALLAFGASLVACEAATNLDVTYGDASTALETGAAADGESADGGEAGAVAVPNGISGCPCDPTAGLGCCMPGSGKPFCTEDTSVCAIRMGTHIRCVRPDPSSESVCCWHGSGAGAVTALAAACDGGPTACSTDSDCAGSGATKCAMAECFGGSIVIGACGTVPPTCPQP
jgi:hypothetical protein